MWEGCEGCGGGLWVPLWPVMCFVGWVFGAGGVGCGGCFLLEFKVWILEYMVLVVGVMMYCVKSGREWMV